MFMQGKTLLIEESIDINKDLEIEIVSSYGIIQLSSRNWGE